MRKIKSLAVLLALIICFSFIPALSKTVMAAGGDINVDTTFSSEFAYWLKNNVEAAKDGKITYSENYDINTLNIDLSLLSYTITDFKGIEKLAYLKDLTIQYSDCTTLDLSSLSNLAKVSIISCSKLQSLNANSAIVYELHVKNCTA